MFVNLIPSTFVSMVDPASTLSIFHVDIDVNMNADIHTTDHSVTVHLFINTEAYDDLAIASIPVADFNAALDLIAEFEANA
jgi:hypothetical protein